MKRFSEQFNKQANSVKLRAAERRALRERLVSYMEYHPLPAEMRSKPAPAIEKTKDLVSDQFVAIKINFTYLKAAMSTMAMLVIVVVPFLAEKSLPGDVLYPVKVQFNEEVRSSLSLSSYAKVEWETERLERRISEARLLASEGKLTEAVEAEVAEAVKAHSDKAKREIATIRETDEDEAAIAEITFASALAVQSEVLENDATEQTENGEVGKSVAKLASVVAEEQQAAEAEQADADPAYEKLLARVESESTRAQELFISISGAASADEQTDIERRLTDIKNKVNTAISIHDAVANNEVTEQEVAAADAIAEVVDEVQSSVGTSTTEEDATTDEKPPVLEVASTTAVVPAESEEVIVVVDDKEARALLRSALSDIRKLISFMTNIDVRENVTIEDLVPVTLTDDEQVALINNLLTEIKAGRTPLEARTVASDFQEKFDLGVSKLEELTAEAERLRAASDYQTAYDVALEAALVLEDLVNRSKAPVDTVVVNPTKEPATSTSATETEETIEDLEEERSSSTEEAVN